MDVSLEQLRAFVAAVEANSSKCGAGHGGLAHPALRAQIRRLETSLRIRVFEPHRRPVQLTEAGLALLPVVKQLLAQFDAAVLQAQDLEPGPPRLEEQGVFSKRQDAE